jgi:glutamate 5-kinase
MGSGGMGSKLKAAEIAARAGIMTFIGSGKDPAVLDKLFEGKILGTLIMPEQKKLKGLKHWLLFAGKPKGEVRIDRGAVKALQEWKKSLLPSGVLTVKGKFQAGDMVRVLDESGKEVAKGLVNFSADDLNRIKGMHTKRIQEVLGVKDYDEVIHRDNLVISEKR